MILNVKLKSKTVLKAFTNIRVHLNKVGVNLIEKIR